MKNEPSTDSQPASQVQRLVSPRSSSSAEQAREMGVAIGDSIEGREEYHDGTWSDARLELAWLGETVAVWRVWRRTWLLRDWRYTGEQANWTLDCRRWTRTNDKLCHAAGSERGAQKEQSK